MRSTRGFFVLLVVMVATIQLLATGRDRIDASRQPARARGAAGPPVAPARLIALFPTVAGWTKGEPDGEVMTAGLTMSVARVRYEKGDLSLAMEITDTLSDPQLMGPVMSGIQAAGAGKRKTETGWARAVTIGGFPGAEVWDDESTAADVMVIVNGRFVVRARVSDVKDTSAARMAVEAVDLKAVAALK